MLAVCLGMSAAQAQDVPAELPLTSDGQRISFEVAVSPGITFSRVWVELDRLGDKDVVGLTDDGSVREDVPWDGVYVGSQSGGYARYVSVRLLGADEGGVETLLWEGTARTADAFHEVLAFRVASDGADVYAQRVAIALPTGPSATAEGVPILVAFGYGVMVLVYVGFLTKARDPGPAA